MTSEGAAQVEPRPIRVYLDTSDYSRFADIGYRDQPGIEGVLTFLREKKAKGIIEIRFSGIHLFEFLKDPTQNRLALKKVQILEDLCGDAAFRYPSDALRREREALSRSADLWNVTTSDEGEWFPETPELSVERDKVIRGLKKKFPQLSRPQLAVLLRRAAAEIKPALSAQMPLAGVYDDGTFERFLTGRISGADMARELAKGFAKPSVLMGHYLAGNPLAQAMFTNFSDQERAMQQLLVRSRGELMQLAARLEEQGKTQDEIRSQMKNHSHRHSAAYLGLETLPGEAREAIEKGRFLPTLPATSTHCSLLAHYFRDIFAPSAVMPEIKQSDPSDILHAFNLPYVDFFRTDGRFASLLGKVAKPTSTTVVGNLLQLPNAIDREIAKRFQRQEK
jgi:hypothetical protein